MTPERWQQIERLCHAALDRDASQRAVFLDGACGGDEVLRQEIESLLAREQSAERFLVAPAAEGVAKGMAEDAALSLIGRQLGTYKVLSLLGAGGMGEVYRARDTQLGRDVAIKILPRVFTSDPDRLARFEREARMLASLNHPHIGAIYGLEDADGIRALVLELVEGQTLADRIAKGPIPLTEALHIAGQISDALEAAHEKGIVHRDLKPTNIKITPEGSVKVLDFGLAKAAGGASSANLTNSPTLTVGGTHDGMILGTAAYMSPEQVRGQPVDKRADIWAFGCVLYEMLTGLSAFARDTITDTLVAIVEREPGWTALPHSTPAGMRRLLQRCLQKDPKRRLHDIADVRIEIDDALIAPTDEAGAPAVAPPRRVAPIAIAALAGGMVIAGFVALVMMGPAPAAPALPSRFAIVPSLAQPLNVSRFDRDLAISPDGRHLVYRAGGSPNVGAPLMVRAIDQLDARQLPGIGALGVFFSPDSRWLGFFSNSEVGTEIKKVSITGGPVITLCTVSGTSLGASWGDDNTIVFATDEPSTGLWRVSADGGRPTALTTPDAAQRESNHGFPSILPGGRGVLFTIIEAGQSNTAQVAVLDLRTGQRKTLARGGSQAEYVDSPAGTGRAGYLTYAAAGTLRAVRFDPARLEMLGDPVTVVERVMIKSNGAANYAVSRQGTLFYVPGGTSVQAAPRSLVWVDRKGDEELLKAPPRAYGVPRLSPDGTRLVVGISEQESADLWIWDLARETMRRLTFSPGYDGLPLWTPDGRRIIFTSDRAGVVNLTSQAADGTGTVDRLTTTANPQYPSSVMPDGTLVVGFHTVPRATSNPVGRVVLFPLKSTASRPGSVPSSPAGSSPAESSDQTLFPGAWPEFSNNGRYLAYQSDESGRAEVYVRPFPQVDSGLWQLSTGGGTRPAWSRNGRELFYLDASNTLTAVPVRTSGSTFSAGQPAKVFDAKYATPFPPRNYDVSPDGRRFLMLKDSAAGNPAATPASMVVVEHWFEEVKARLPPK